MYVFSIEKLYCGKNVFPTNNFRTNVKIWEHWFSDIIMCLMLTWFKDFCHPFTMYKVLQEYYTGKGRK